MGKSSITRQIKQRFNRMFTPGESKREARRDAAGPYFLLQDAGGL